MFNLDDITAKNDNKGWPYRTLVIGPSGSGKINYLLNKIQTDNNIIDKIHLYAKDSEEPKYQLLIKKREQVGIKNSKDNITMLLLNILTVWMIFMMTLMIIIKKGKEKY